MNGFNSTSYGSYRTRPMWREYHTRRFQNKMESLSLQEQQSELRLRAAEMAQEQKIKSLNDRLCSQDRAIELMRQRHRNETRDLRDLQGRRLSSSHYDKVMKGAKKLATSDACPVEDLKRFMKLMDERYEKLMNPRPSSRSLRMNSEQPLGYFSHRPDPVSYRSVKDMLNHLPQTPIFKETTCSLLGLQTRSSDNAAHKQAVPSEGSLASSKHKESDSYTGAAIRATNGPVNLLVRRQRDVAVPMKDVPSKGNLENNAKFTHRSSEPILRRSDIEWVDRSGNRRLSVRKASVSDDSRALHLDNAMRPILNGFQNVSGYKGNSLNLDKIDERRVSATGRSSRGEGLSLFTDKAMEFSK